MHPMVIIALADEKTNDLRADALRTSGRDVAGTGSRNLLNRLSFSGRLRVPQLGRRLRAAGR